jgi:hypothetical protein
MIKTISTNNAKLVCTFTFLALLFICFNCSSIKKANNNALISIKLSFSFPIVKPDGEMFNISDSLYIYFYKKTVLYQVPTIFTLENETETLQKEIRYSYFMYQDTSKYGRHFKTLHSKEDSLQLISVFIKDRAFNEFADFKFITEIKDSLIRVENNNDYLKYTYIPKSLNTIDSDTTYLFYQNNFDKMNYSISPNLDTISKMKLCKVQVIYNKKYSDINKIVMPRREIYFAITKHEAKNKEDIIRFIETL